MLPESWKKLYILLPSFCTKNTKFKDIYKTKEKQFRAICSLVVEMSRYIATQTAIV